MSMNAVGNPVRVLINEQTEMRVYSRSSSAMLQYKDLPEPMSVSTVRVMAEEGSQPSTCFFHREPDVDSFSAGIQSTSTQPGQSRSILSEPFTTEEGPRSLKQPFADATRIYCYLTANDVPLGESFTVFVENAEGQAVLERPSFTNDGDDNNRERVAIFSVPANVRGRF